MLRRRRDPKEEAPRKAERGQEADARIWQCEHSAGGFHRGAADGRRQLGPGRIVLRTERPAPARYRGHPGRSARKGRRERPGALLLPSMKAGLLRSEEHTSELQSLMRISYAVFCLKKKN